MKMKFVVKFKNSPNKEVREYQVFINDESQIWQGQALCWSKYQKVLNSLNFCSEEEKELVSFPHEIEVLKNESSSRGTPPKREKDEELCAWEHVQSF